MHNRKIITTFAAVIFLKILLPPLREGRGRQIMKKLFTLFLALVASVGIIYASDTQVDGIWYDLTIPIIPLPSLTAEGVSIAIMMNILVQ